MADSFIQGSITFACTHAEMALLEEAFQATYDFMAGDMPDTPSPEFQAVFPPTAPHDPWSGFREIFPDPDYPTFGADLGGGNSIAEPHLSRPILFGMTDFQPEPIAALLQRCCQETLATGPIGFEWALSCSKPRIGEFGGGWCAIFADRIAMETSQDALSRALASDMI